MTVRAASPTRDVAMTRILAQVAWFPELRFGPRAKAGERKGSERKDGESAPESALASAIEAATIRHWLTSETIARSLCTRPWLEVQPEVRAALLVGVTQLFQMPREPDHAVVDDAVRWTRGRLQQGAGGFVNAVLRKAIALRGERVPDAAATAWWERRDAIPCPDGSLVLLTHEMLPADPLARLGAQTSHPVALVTRWAAKRGIEVARQFAAHSLMEMPITLHDGAGTIGAARATWMDHAEPHDCEGHFVWQGSVKALSEVLAAHPSLIVQDPASARAVASTRDLTPKRILDACAGRGTKAVQLALTHPNAEVWATDTDEARLAALRQRAAGVANLRVVDLAELGTLPGHFDLMLLDVPCSNTGVLARRLEARYRFNDRSLAEVTQLQRGIAEHHRGLVAKGGMIVWSTCSLEPAENADQAKWLARMVKGRVVTESEWLPRGGPGDPPKSCTDGSYHARIVLP